MANEALTDSQAATALADAMQSTDPADARGAGTKDYPKPGDTKTHNGETVEFNGRVWMRPCGKPAW